MKTRNQIWSNVRLVAMVLFASAMYAMGRSLAGPSPDVTMPLGVLGVFCAVASLCRLAFKASGRGKVGLGLLAAAGAGVAIGAASMEADFARRIAAILCMSAMPLSIFGASLEVRRRRQADSRGRPSKP
ncbi:hypothetical protein WMF31_40520 [Sorangium sp. So ce1036]|uniref:hypothetical protein n=1 Tax=Sorangium sp. So ce1036 TaxID=3133328 RepID=UPI003F101C8F